MLALLLGLISNASFATPNEHRANVTQRIYNLDYWDNHRYGGFIKEHLANTHANQRYGKEAIDKSSWIESDTKHAWAQGYAGQGVSVGVLDNWNDTDRMGWINTRGAYHIYRPSHGDKTSAIIGGKGTFGTSDTNVVGIAPEATINKYWGGSYYQGVASQENDIVNMSFGSYRPSWTITTDNYYKNYQYNYYNTDAFNTDTLYVRSAGNLGVSCQRGGKCSESSLAMLNSKLRDSTLIVGALDGDTIAGYSNRAGITKNNFVVDDGTISYKYEKYGDTGHGSTMGTSFSAPRVSGKAAIIKSKFSNLNGAQLANIIKTTADDLGAPGVDNIYGHGKVNLKRALSPVGNLR